MVSLEWEGRGGFPPQPPVPFVLVVEGGGSRVPGSWVAGSLPQAVGFLCFCLPRTELWVPPELHPQSTALLGVFASSYCFNCLLECAEGATSVFPDCSPLAAWRTSPPICPSGPRTHYVENPSHYLLSLSPALFPFIKE